MREHSRTRIVAAVFAIAAVIPSIATAGTIALRWDALVGASGYRVHYGTSPGSYGQSVDVGSAVQATLTGLVDCTMYYVAVKAYNSLGESASYSNEVTGWARPEISAGSPEQVRQGDQLTLSISGANFQPGAQLAYEIVGLPRDVDGDDLVRLDNVSVVSCDEIQALLTVEPTARGQRAMELGEFDVKVEVVNPDAVFGASSETLTVQFGESRADINRSDSATTGRVDGKDLVWLAFAFGSSEGDPTHNPDSDLNGDGVVDGEDLVYLATRFGRCWTGSSWSMSACP